MRDDNEFKNRLDDLRRRAESHLSASGVPGEAASDDAARRLVHDLQVHQIELEMQNDALRDAQQALEQSRDRYLELYHHAPVGYVVTDSAGMILQANQTFGQMLNTVPAAIIDKPLARVIHADDRPVFFSRFNAFYKNPAGKRIEIRMQKDDGSMLHTLIEGRRIDRAEALAGTPDQPARLLITISDVTEKKRAERSIVEAKRQWEQTFDAVPDLIAIIDDHAAIVRVNQALAHRLGVEPQACVGRKHHAVFYDGRTPPANCPCERFMAEGQPAQTEMHCPKLKGDFIVSASPFNTGDRALRWCILIYHDITDRKRAEVELLKLRNLESIGMLAGGIAHDFNNILMALMGNIELAQLNGVDDDAGTFLKAALDAAFRAKDLANRLLTFAKGGSPQVRPAMIDQLLEETLQLGLSGSNVTYRLEMTTSLPPIVVDDTQIKSALQHIITNAKEAMPWGGGLTVRVDKIAVGNEDGHLMTPGEYVRIAIRDEGGGIRPDHLDKVFDPYFTTKQMGTQKGMGLGLAISHSIIKKHDGHIAVRSAGKEGATVTIHLPLPSRPAMAGPSRQAIGSGHARRRILLMDDEQSIWEVVRPVFQSLNCEADFAPDGKTAIALYRRAFDAGRPYAVSILDLTIRGGMGATDVIRRILAIDPAARAAVFSGYGTHPVMADYRRYGFVGALQKPVQVERFRSFVAEMLTRAHDPPRREASPSDGDGAGPAPGSRLP